MYIGSHSGTILVVFGALFLFSFFYDRFVDWLQASGYDEGYTAILVVLGVIVTLIGLAIIDPEKAPTNFGAFACSGFWMVVGSWWRHVVKRRKAQEALRNFQEDRENDGQTQGMAESR